MIRIVLIVLLSAAPIIARGAEPEIVQLSADTYIAVVKNYAGIFGNPQTTKTKAIKAANAFAAKHDKVAVPIAMEITPAGGPGHWPAAEYQFRLAEQGSQGTAGGALLPRADVTVEVNTSSLSTQGIAPPPATKLDLYAELLKLDDLRKRGLLTDAEFDVAKRRLLDSL